MAESTHTSEMLYNLMRGTGRSDGKLWSGKIAVSDTETLDTGLSSIDSLSNDVEDAVVLSSGVLKVVCPNSISGGTITYCAQQVTLTEATDANRVFSASTDTTAYVIAIGRA